MANDSDDLEEAVDRLEAALQRIAQVAASRGATPDDPPPAFATQEIAARLDGLIDRLRVALGARAG